jgi:hypothetical protein
MVALLWPGGKVKPSGATAIASKPATVGRLVASATERTPGTAAALAVSSR